MFQHTRDVPPEWQADLESVIPRSDRVSWLTIVWQPGMPYEPVQRWELYEVIPTLDHVPPEVIEDLRGMSPRHPENGVWRHDASVMGERRWFSNSLVSLVQWQTYQKLGLYTQRFWCIQGEYGGHPLKYTDAELNFRLSKGLTDAPCPGDLPYADYSHRVATRAASLDRMRKWKQATGWDQRGLRKTEAGLLVRRDRAAEELQYSEMMLAWMDEEIAGAISDMPRSVAAKIVGDAPVGEDGTKHEDLDALDRELTNATASALKGTY